MSKKLEKWLPRQHAYSVSLGNLRWKNPNFQNLSPCPKARLELEILPIYQRTNSSKLDSLPTNLSVGSVIKYQYFFTWNSILTFCKACATCTASPPPPPRSIWLALSKLPFNIPPGSSGFVPGCAFGNVWEFGSVPLSAAWSEFSGFDGSIEMEARFKKCLKVNKK